jgi:dephospho-CoA kinase
MKAQLPIKKYLELADIVIKNNGTKRLLKKSVEEKLLNLPEG